jgi:hypothetical protein
MMIRMMLIPPLMFKKKRTRTGAAFFVSPANAGKITLGKTLAAAFLCFLSIILVGLFNANLILQWRLVLLAGICVACSSISLDLSLRTMMDNRQKSSVIANFTNFSIIIIKILSIEADFIPAWLGTIFRWLPTTATFDLLQLPFVPQASLVFIASCMVVPLPFVTILLDVAAWKMKRADWILEAYD